MCSLPTRPLGRRALESSILYIENYESCVPGTPQYGHNRQTVRLKSLGFFKRFCIGDKERVRREHGCGHYFPLDTTDNRQQTTALLVL